MLNSKILSKEIKTRLERKIKRICLWPISTRYCGGQGGWLQVEISQTS